jgi:hypothetical protein
VYARHIGRRGRQKRGRNGRVGGQLWNQQ